MDSARTRRPAGNDRSRTQRAALRVGLWVGLASAAIMGLIIAITIPVIALASRPDRRPGRGGGRFEDRVVGLSDLVPLAIVLVIVGVVALALIAWYAARRATIPLADALSVQRAFVADASHELRTPLTTLTSRIQLAQHRLERDGDVASVLEQLRRDADTMNGMLTDLLLAAEAAGEASIGANARSDVAEAVHSAIAVIEPQAAAQNVVLEEDVAAGIVAAVDRLALERALIALLDNAVRHSPPAGIVRVSAMLNGQSIEIRVADHGAGINDVDPDRLFDRFAHSDTAGSRRGFGLGLALVRDIAQRFAGTIRIERTSPEGTTFLLTFPRAD